MRYHHLFAPVLIALSVATSAPASAPPLAVAQGYTQLVVFGDSLSDNGNFFAATANPPAPYWQGRFTNGPVWVEQMLTHLDLAPAQLDDKAVGFATTADVLNAQVLPYVAAQVTLDSEALYVYWAGANDLFDLLEAPGTDPAVVLGQAMQNTGDALIALLASGAQHVLVPNLPDLSSTPLLIELGDPLLAIDVQNLVIAYNFHLGQLLDSLEVPFGVEFVRLDTYSLTYAMSHDFTAGGFSVVNQRALSPTGVVAPNVGQYLFWDHVHPTRKGHSFIMGAALFELGVLWGDANGDGLLSLRDFHRVQDSFGPCAVGTAADLDGDGHVDPQDLRLLRVLIY